MRSDWDLTLSAPIDATRREPRFRRFNADGYMMQIPRRRMMTVAQTQGDLGYTSPSAIVRGHQPFSLGHQILGSWTALDRSTNRALPGPMTHVWTIFVGGSTAPPSGQH
jgi:hypothetical protein